MENFLFPLQPFGMGTDEIESFASYFGRLALTHGVSRSQLTRMLAAWKSTTSGMKMVISETPVYSTRGAGLAGFGDRVQQLVDLVGSATGNEGIDRLTLLKARTAFAGNAANTVKRDRAWCEQCFREDLSGHGQVYDRLVWTLWGTQRCRTHRLLLRTTCPHCASPQNFHHRSGNAVLCVRCSKNLIGTPNSHAYAPNPDDAEEACLQLAGALARGDIDGINEGNSLHRFEGKLSLIKGPFYARSWTEDKPRKPITRPSLRTYIAVCNEYAVSIVDLLLAPEETALHAGRSFFAAKSIPAEVRVRHPHEVLEEVRDAIRLALDKPRSEQIPRLRDFAQALGVSEGYVRHHFKAEVEAFQSHRLAAHMFAVRESGKRAAKAAEEIILLHGQSLETLKSLEAEVCRVAECSVPVARRALAKARNAALVTGEASPILQSELVFPGRDSQGAAWDDVSEEVRDSAVRMIRELEANHYNQETAVKYVRSKIGLGLTTLRRWAREG